MRGVSAQGRTAVVERLEQALGSGGHGSSAEAMGDELFSVAGLLDAQPALRRAVTDPGTPGEARRALTARVLDGRVSEATADVVGAGAVQRWSSSRDLADALEHAGVVAHVQAADDAGSLDEVEDELFRFGRVVGAHPQLRDAFGDRSAPVEGRSALVDDLLADKGTGATRRLAAQAASGRHRSLVAALEEFAGVVAQRRDRLVATVTVAQPLSSDDSDRLGQALAQQYGRQVHLNVVVDAEVLGGVRVEVGDEVLDGTVHTRVEHARRRLAG